MNSFLESIDIYGKELKLRINDSTEAKTKSGGFFTLVTGGLLLILTYLLGNDVIYREKPISFSESVTLPEHPPLLLNATTYPLAFVITDSIGNIINNKSLFNIEITYIEGRLEGDNPVYKKTILPLTQCNYSHFAGADPKIIPEDFLGYTCIDNQNITLKGYWGDKEITALIVNFNICDYDNTPDQCASKEEINYYLANYEVTANILTIENSVFVSNYSQPLAQFFNNPYKLFHNETLKITEYFIQNQTLRTDAGFFSVSHEYKYFLKLVEQQTDFTVISPTKNAVRFVLYSSSQQDRYYRSYIKITELFGSLGGILKVLLIFFYYINLPFSSIQAYVSITEQSANINESKQSKRDLNNIFQNHNINNEKLKLAKKLDLSELGNINANNKALAVPANNNSYNIEALSRSNNQIRILEVSPFCNIKKVPEIVNPMLNASNNIHLSVFKVSIIKLKEFLFCKHLNAEDQKYFDFYNYEVKEIKNLFNVGILFGKVLNNSLKNKAKYSKEQNHNKFEQIII